MELDGELPLNTFGGSLAPGASTASGHIIEGALQISQQQQRGAGVWRALDDMPEAVEAPRCPGSRRRCSAAARRPYAAVLELKSALASWQKP